MAYLTTDMSESITEEHLESLHKANIWTVNDICSNDLIEIKRTTSIKYHILKDLQDKVKQRYVLPCYELNILLEKSIQECKMVPTGLPELTLALDGGFQTQEIVEFYGDSECGKTELCYLLCGEILSHYDDYRVLFVASTNDFEYQKVARYTRFKAGNRELSDEDIYNLLGRIDVARPTKLADLVHLLNTIVHSDKRNNIKCIIIDSLSFIIQEEVLQIRTANLEDGDELEKFSAFINKSLIHNEAGPEILRRKLIDCYLHEVMRILTHVAFSKNVIVVITNSDQRLAYYKSWSNAIDHRLLLTKMSEHNRYFLNNPQSTFCQATIVKTIHNITRVGFTVPFAINDEGLFALRLKPVPEPEAKDGILSDSEQSGL